MDPGVMAAIGAAGLLGGVNRIATASTVIVVRNAYSYTVKQCPVYSSLWETYY